MTDIQKAYSMGFRKAAEDNGIDPAVLTKMAFEFKDIQDWYKNLDPTYRNMMTDALMGGGIAGIGSAILSKKNKLRNGLLAALAGAPAAALGGYGGRKLESYIADKVKNYIEVKRQGVTNEQLGLSQDSSNEERLAVSQRLQDAQRPSDPVDENIPLDVMRSQYFKFKHKPYNGSDKGLRLWYAKTFG